MTTHSVLRIGPLTNPNASLLRSAIASHFKSSPPSDDDGDASSAADGDDDELIVSNRYFTASVLLKGLHQDIHTVDNTRGRHCIEDGIILVFDAELSSSSSSRQYNFDTLQSLHEAAISNDRAGETLRLVAGIRFTSPPPLSDGSKRSEEEYSRRVLWCLDYGYEYVEIDLSAEGKKRGFDERDKEGFARCVEAIEGCMWSSHVMKQRVGSGRGGGRGGTINASVVAKGVTSKDNLTEVGEMKTTDDEQDTTVTLKSTAIDTSSDAEREAAAMQSLLQGVDKDSNRNDDTSPHDDHDNNIQQHELSFSELEHVMKEAKRIREASKNECMTDEERRQRAGDTAVKLMGLLERLGFDDDEEEENEDSDTDNPEIILAT